MLIALCGVPASGKSSLAKRLATVLEVRRCPGEREVVMVSNDEIEKRLHSISTKPARAGWHAARFIAREQLRLHLERGRCVILDDTLHLRSMRRQVRGMCSAIGSSYISLHMSVGVEVALLRNRRRPIQSRVSEETIRKIHGDMEIPNDGAHWTQWERDSFLSIDGSKS